MTLSFLPLFVLFSLFIYGGCSDKPDPSKKSTLEDTPRIQEIVRAAQAVVCPGAIVNDDNGASVTFVFDLPNEIFLYIINEIFVDEHKRFIFSPSFRLVSKTWKEWHDRQFRVLPIVAPSSENTVLDCTNMEKGKCLVIKRMPKEKWNDIVSLGSLVEFKLHGFALQHVNTDILSAILRKSSESLTSIEFVGCKFHNLSFLEPCKKLHTIILDDCLLAQGTFPYLPSVTKMVWKDVLFAGVEEMDNFNPIADGGIRLYPFFDNTLTIFLDMALPNISHFTLSYPDSDNWNSVQFIENFHSLKHLTIIPDISVNQPEREFTGAQLFQVLNSCKSGLESLTIAGYSIVGICSDFPEHTLNSLKTLSILGSNLSFPPTKICESLNLQRLTSLEVIVFDRCKLENDDDEILLKPVALRKFLPKLKVVTINGHNLEEY